MNHLRYAARSLLRSPGFTLTALLTLGLGIGANTAMFSVMHAVLLRPLPYAAPDRLVFIWSSTSTVSRINLTPGRLIDFREQMTSASAVAGFSHLSFNLTGDDNPERIVGSSVSSNFFDLLGVRALLGDPFHAGSADAHDVVLGYGLWRNRFGADRRIVGRDIVLDGVARRVRAVMPPEFEWPTVTARGSTNADAPELWIPAGLHDIPGMLRTDSNEDLSGNRNIGYLRAVARLDEGVSIEQAQREADVIAQRLAALYPRTDASRGAVVEPLRQQFFGAVRQPLAVLSVAVAFVLVIACANAASLLLGRASARRKEIAIRLALGAPRIGIVRELLTEAILLSLGAGAFGLLLAWWTRSWLVGMAPEDTFRLHTSGVDWTVLLFAIAIALVTGLLFGMLPAWQVSGGNPGAAVAEGGSRGSAGRSASRTRDVLVIGQIAVSLVLLVGAGLLLRSFATLTRVDTGIDTLRLLTFEVSLAGGRSEDPTRQAPFYDEILHALRALPGVRAAGAAVTLPIGGDDFGTTVVPEGRAFSPGEEPIVGYQIVTPGYFETMGMRIRSGRDFLSSDTRDSAPVALVNETLARQLWPGEDPVGRRLRGRDASDPWSTVIGVVSDIRHLGPAAPPRPELYEVHTQSPFSFMVFVVRTTVEPTALVPSIRTSISSLDPAQPISDVRTMEEHLARSLARPRFLSALTGAFGAIALLLAVIGLYGLMAYAVTQRTAEIAIRCALGATRLDVVRLVLGKGFALALAGVGAGAIAAVLATQLLTGLLFGVSAQDPVTYVAAGMLLIVVALAAGLVPSRRAASIDPVRALRSE